MATAIHRSQQNQGVTIEYNANMIPEGDVYRLVAKSTPVELLDEIFEGKEAA